MSTKVFSLEEAVSVIKALSKPLALDILMLLKHHSMNVNQIASELHIPQSTCAVNIRSLEKAGLIKTINAAASKGTQKICSVDIDELVITFAEEPEVNEKQIVTEMPIGLYTEFEVSPPCGLVSVDKIIGFFDQQSSFLNPQRAAASLIWFSKGFLVYRFPKNYPTSRNVESVSLTCEICSEFPGYKNDWPSDITLYINNAEIGTWTSPGDMGGKYGVWTPRWWDLKNSQYGFLKTWKVTADGSYIDGELCSTKTLSDIKIDSCDSFFVKIGVKDNAENLGGMNLFGKGFGNYNTDISFKVEFS